MDAASKAVAPLLVGNTWFSVAVVEIPNARLVELVVASTVVVVFPELVAGCVSEKKAW